MTSKRTPCSQCGTPVEYTDRFLGRKNTPMEQGVIDSRHERVHTPARCKEAQQKGGKR